MAIFCASCGTQNLDSATFCSKCGKSIPQPTAPAAPGAGAGVAPQAAAQVNNVIGGLAYVTFIPAIIFLLVEPYKHDHFVRFHSWQEILLCVARVVVYLVTFWVPLPGAGWILRSLIGLVFFVAWLVAIINAFQGKMWKIPLIGDMAEAQAGKI